MMKELKIDKELKEFLPPITDEEHKKLEESLLKYGYDKNFPIMVWKGYIADGHNRYEICKKHNIEYTIGTLGYETKEEVIGWMVDMQLGRRNLSPIQRIAVAEKYKPFFEKKAKENLVKAGKEYGVGYKKPSSNLTNPIRSENKIDVREELAGKAGVGTGTYTMGKKILDSTNEEVKQAVLSGSMSINAGYNKIREQEKSIPVSKTHADDLRQALKKAPQIQLNNKHANTVKEICRDLKTEKTKEYLDSIWNYKISVIECLNADFEMYYDGFVSTLSRMDGHVTTDELNECIAAAEDNLWKLLAAIEEARKNTTLKMEK